MKVIDGEGNEFSIPDNARLVAVDLAKQKKPMKTKEEVLAAVKAGRKSECLDGRDYQRLLAWFPQEEVETFGFKLKEDAKDKTFEPKEWSEQAILEQLEEDVAFGFQKALDKRGISASFMHSVVEMWLWVLNDEEFKDLDYAQYGLPLLKAVAVKYGFPNPIGADAGTESQYESD